MLDRSLGENLVVTAGHAGKRWTQWTAWQIGATLSIDSDQGAAGKHTLISYPGSAQAQAFH